MTKNVFGRFIKSGHEETNIDNTVGGNLARRVKN